jgi:hypothetical protein
MASSPTFVKTEVRLTLNVAVCKKLSSDPPWPQPPEPMPWVYRSLALRRKQLRRSPFCPSGKYQLECARVKASMIFCAVGVGPALLQLAVQSGDDRAGAFDQSGARSRNSGSGTGLKG